MKRRELKRYPSRYRAKKARIDAIKLERGCADCGYREHPAALDFDHLPGTKKRRNISRMLASVSKGVELIDAEIAKCEVVCANCHRIRTWKRKSAKRP
jgi:hypothetical protein